MGVPFLHRFRTSTQGFMPGSGELRQTICEWPLSLVGPQGPQTLPFRIIGIGEAAPRAAGIFIYARRRPDGQWQAMFIGETSNMRNRLSFNEIAADALLSGATDIHILLTGSDATARRDTCERMVRTNNPLLNEARTKPAPGNAPAREGRKTNAA